MHWGVSLVATLAFLLALGFGLSVVFADDDDDEDSTLAGSWTATVTATDPPGLEPFTSLITFAPGGGVVESRRLYVPVSPLGPLLETPGHGEWVNTGKRKFEVEFVFLLQGASNNPTSNGTFLGTDTIRLRLELNKAGDELNGSFESVITDPSGMEIFIATGTYVATPIKVRPTRR